MHPHHPEPGRGFGPPTHPPQGPPPPPGPPPHWGAPGTTPPQPPPKPPGRYGTGTVAVLAVIAVLAGGSFLGGGLSLGGSVLDGLAQEEDVPLTTPSAPPPEGPTPEPAPETTPSQEPAPEPPPTEASEELITAPELVGELDGDFDISDRLNITADVCSTAEGEHPAPLQCTTAMDTNLMRVVAFDGSGLALLAAAALEGQEDSDLVDVRSACHFVLLWFDEEGVMGQDQRDAMVTAAEEISGCS
ncbi:hypothetical protein [Nocardiopsis sp. CNT312]|uniref:hypothetical protein n=1 Tax=Nocardiopsis sp. CNT312 TaxID=1137268 RepID=UPI0004B97B2C|nr:hypothetical protein [Nocardiopsis sp. CNT312]